MNPLFELGQVVATRGITELLEHQEVIELVSKHVYGDFGVLDKHDTDLNKSAIKNKDDRIFSAYNVKGEKIYVITEWDRSVTTVLLANEY